MNAAALIESAIARITRRVLESRLVTSVAITTLFTPGFRIVVELRIEPMPPEHAAITGRAECDDPVPTLKQPSPTPSLPSSLQ